MCGLGPEASPKDGVVGDGGYMASERESHAKTPKAPVIYIPALPAILIFGCLVEARGIERQFQDRT